MLSGWENVRLEFLKGYLRTKYNLKELLLNERGDVTTVSILGWAAVVITLIVAAHGLLTGWLPNFISTKIFDRANTL
jgi:hypothetical protein